ncbi:MAG: enoyl-CoA hydratase/isomerase family protein [Deltaproteobacteria bacterium]|nr:enoyl-CoA hydratase/isomerase family protein [Deltaproteobacteria bacterium]
MAVNHVTTRREGGITILTLNRPDKLNALNKDIFDDLKSALDMIQTDASVRVLVIIGGGKAFSVGADLKERQGMNEKDILLRFEAVRVLYQRLEYFPLPTIAAINGTALGGGLELALCCDIRVVSQAATLGFPEVELAIIPGNGGTQRLPRLIGVSKAMELILTAKRLSADEALGLGIVSHVAPDALVAARTLAVRMLDMGPIALKQAKLAVKKGIELPIGDALKFEVDCYKNCLYSKDRTEGLKAFSEKRRPEYQGE